MPSIARFLIVLGIVFIVIGAVLLIFPGATIFRLPGDIVIKRGNFTLIFPIATSILLSFIITVILRFLFRK